MRNKPRDLCLEAVAIEKEICKKEQRGMSMEKHCLQGFVHILLNILSLFYFHFSIFSHQLVNSLKIRITYALLLIT